MIEKILTVINHPQPIRKFLKGMKIRIGKTRGALWCAFKPLNNNEILEKIEVLPEKNFYKKFKEELNYAKDRVKHCPVKMGGPGNLNIIYQLTEHLNATRIIETGVAYGWSSLTFLLSIKDRENSLLISTDLPYSEETAPYVGCVVPEYLREKWKIIKKSDREALPEALKVLPEIDICHYDSDKTYEGRMFTYPFLWNALRKGGIFISDDISDNLAFRDFSKKINIDPIVIRSKNKFVGILIK